MFTVDWVFYSNLHIGVIAASLLLANGMLLGIAPSWPLLALAVSGSILIYHLDHFWLASKEDHINHSERIVWQQSHHLYMYVSSFGCVVVAMTSAVFLNLQTLLVALLLGVCGAIYNVPWWQRRPKEFGSVKPFLITGAWAVGSVVPIVLAQEEPMRAVVWLLIAYRFLYILPNLLIVDWLDQAGDKAAGIWTLVAAWTEMKLRAVVTIVGMCTLLSGAWLATNVSLGWLIYIDMIGSIVLVALIWWEKGRAFPLYRGWLDLVIAWPWATVLVPLIL